VGRNAKVGIAGAVVLVLAVATLFMEGISPIIPIAIVVIGGAGIFLLLRQEEDDDEDERPKAKAKKGKARLDEILDDQAKGSTTTTTKRPTTPAAPAGGGLPTWSPGSVDSGSTTDDLIAADADDTWDAWDKDGGWSDGDADTLVLDDDPLSSLDRLDDIDPVAEVERIEAAADDDPFASLRSDLASDDTFELDELDDFEVELDEPAPASSGSAFSFSGAPKVINEEVSTADDIMAASTATELHVDEAGDSELARLLAKVQARLSAYE
jgi:hypothetical protein